MVTHCVVVTCGPLVGSTNVLLWPRTGLVHTSSMDQAGPGPKLNPLDLMNGYLNSVVVN